MITNTPQNTSDARIEDLRAGIEHRATWFALMIDEARKRGLDEAFAREAIFRCGCFHADVKFPHTDDLPTFTEAFANDNVIKIFEMELKKVDEKNMDIDFHYCPLVTAWQKLGFSDKDIEMFCDIAMDGDRGIVHEYEAFDFNLGKTIAKGDRVCEISVTKK